jgi:NAD(P)-dependent dehydrogenase (short-subunit alcohol dehydrogenase family)
MATSTSTITGNTAIVTGAGSGIGLAIASALCQVGVDVGISDIDEEALEQAAASLNRYDGEVVTVVADHATDDAGATLVETTVSNYGGLDIVVNNVGIAGPTLPCEQVSREAFMDTLRVNLGGMFSTTRAAIPHLRSSDAGRIINLSSMSGKRPLLHRTPYTTSKMGVIGFTRTLAVELADDQITVNAICPGSIEGPRLEAVIRGQADSQGRPVADVKAEFREGAPLKTFVQAEDIAHTVLHLCSDEAGIMTGQDVNVTAGMVMY